MTQKDRSRRGTGADDPTGDIDLGKPGSRGRPGVASDALFRTSAGLATFLGGVSQSMAAAFDELHQKLTPDNVTEIGLSNGFIEGVAAGNARFFEELAKTSRSTFEALQSEQASDIDVAIDYERLSKLVAEEMLKQRGSSD